MLVGLLGDTHDRIPAIAELVKRMIEAGAGMILHVGDYSSPFSLAPIHDANIPLAGVFGERRRPRGMLRTREGRGPELSNRQQCEVGVAAPPCGADVGEVGPFRKGAWHHRQGMIAMRREDSR